MSNQRNFKLIQGGKYDGLGLAGRGKALVKKPPSQPKLRFLGAEATTTRLMGVVGVVAQYLDEAGQKLTQILHLDYEEYGIDGYQLFVEPSQTELQREISKVTGGLGGHFVGLSFEQFHTLVYEAYLLDTGSVHVAYDLKPDFAALLEPITLEPQAYVALMDLVGPKPETDFGLLNHALMRMTGLDDPGFAYLSSAPLPTAWYQEVTSPGTLLKNTITAMSVVEVEGVRGLKAYRCEALIDQYDLYKLMHLRFQVADTAYGRRIVGLEIESSMNISAYEASFQLRKREHIAVYEILGLNFEAGFENRYPEMMKNGHGSGDLFTRFNADNRHVDAAVYYLSGDVFANYFITDEDQMVVSSFSLDALDQIENELADGFEGQLAKVGEMTADQSILYEFVTSGYGDIYAYLDDSKP